MTNMTDDNDEWTGPFKKERIAADKALENGDDEIEYRGMTFFVDDTDNGWTYAIDRSVFESLDDVFDYIDKATDKEEVAR